MPAATVDILRCLISTAGPLGFLPAIHLQNAFLLLPSRIAILIRAADHYCLPDDLGRTPIAAKQHRCMRILQLRTEVR